MHCGRCGHALDVIDYLCPACKRQSQRDVFGGKTLAELPVVTRVARLRGDERGRR